MRETFAILFYLKKGKKKRGNLIPLPKQQFIADYPSAEHNLHLALF